MERTLIIFVSVQTDRFKYSSC